MSGLFGMLFALAATLWAMPYLLVAGGIALVIWLMVRELRRQGENELAERRRMREIAARADDQHQQVLRGEHVVTRINAHYYVCDRCGDAGSERWAILHQYPSTTKVNTP